MPNPTIYEMYESWVEKTLKKSFPDILRKTYAHSFSVEAEHLFSNYGSYMEYKRTEDDNDTIKPKFSQYVSDLGLPTYFENLLLKEFDSFSKNVYLDSNTTHIVTDQSVLGVVPVLRKFPSLLPKYGYKTFEENKNDWLHEFCIALEQYYDIDTFFRPVPEEDFDTLSAQTREFINYYKEKCDSKSLAFRWRELELLFIEPNIEYPFGLISIYGIKIKRKDRINGYAYHRYAFPLISFDDALSRIPVARKIIQFYLATINPMDVFCLLTEIVRLKTQ